MDPPSPSTTAPVEDTPCPRLDNSLGVLSKIHISNKEKRGGRPSHEICQRHSNYGLTCKLKTGSSWKRPLINLRMWDKKVWFIGRGCWVAGWCTHGSAQVGGAATLSFLSLVGGTPWTSIDLLQTFVLTKTIFLCSKRLFSLSSLGNEIKEQSKRMKICCTERSERRQRALQSLE